MASWNGRVVIRNCVDKPTSPKNVSPFRGSNDGAHDFGYECRLPEGFDIDGLLVKDGAETEGAGLRWFAAFNRRQKEPGYKERFPLVRPKKAGSRQGTDRIGARYRYQLDARHVQERDRRETLKPDALTWMGMS